MSGTAIVAMGKSKVTGIAWAVGAGVTLALALLFVPLFGPLAATLSIFAGFLAVNAVHLGYLRYSIGLVPVDSRMIRTLVGIAILSLIFKIVLLDFIDTSNLFMIIPALLLSCIAVFGGITLFGGLSSEDLLFVDFLERISGRKLNWIRDFLMKFIKQSPQ